MCQVSHRFHVMQVYAGPLKGGSRAVVFFNRHVFSSQYPISNITVSWEDLGYPSDTDATVRDLHATKNLGTFSHAFTAAVDIHDARMVKITPKKIRPGYEEWRPWTQHDNRMAGQDLRLPTLNTSS